MTDKKLTDNEIKKALECCTDFDIDACDKCPIRMFCYTQSVDIKKEALDLINRLQAENERLRPFRDTAYDVLKTNHFAIKAEAYKECIEKVLEKKWDVPYKTKDAHYVQVVDVGDIEDTLKELVGEDNAIKEFTDGLLAEAYKEFAERLKDDFCASCSTHKRYHLTIEQCRGKENPHRKWCFKMRLIDNLLKELVGEDNG